MEEKTFILNDKHEIYMLYKSQCSKCLHFDMFNYKCKAFPNGIPDNLLSGEEKHNTPLIEQTGDIVFEPK